MLRNALIPTFFMELYSEEYREYPDSVFWVSAVLLYGRCFQCWTARDVVRIIARPEVAAAAKTCATRAFTEQGTAYD